MKWSAADEQGIGDLVVTTLTNDFMPLIRYRIGDLVEQLGHPRTRATWCMARGERVLHAGPAPRDDLAD